MSANEQVTISKSLFIELLQCVNDKYSDAMQAGEFDTANEVCELKSEIITELLDSAQGGDQ